MGLTGYHHDAIGLHGDTGQALAHDTGRHHHLGALQCRFVSQRGLKSQIGAIFVEQDGGAIGQCRLGVSDDGQQFDVHHHLLGGILGLGLGFGHDGRHHVTHKTDLATGEHRAVEQRRQHREALEVGEAQISTGIHSHHTGHGEGPRRVHRTQVAVGHIGAHEVNVKGIGDLEVIGVFAGTNQQFGVFATEDGVTKNRTGRGHDRCSRQ